MSQEASSDPQRPQPAPPNTNHAETPRTLPSTHAQDSSPFNHGRQMSAQEPLPSILSRRTSSQDRSSVPGHRRVSIQEPLPSILGRHVSLQGSPPAHSHRRVSIQEPLPEFGFQKPSVQGSPPAHSHRRVSIQESPINLPHRSSIQDTPPITYNRWVTTQDAPSVLQDHFSLQSTYPLTSIQSESPSEPTNTQAPPKSKKVSLVSKPVRPPDSISQEATPVSQTTINRVDSLAWDSDGTLREEDYSHRLKQDAMDSTTQYMSRRSTGIYGYQGKYSRPSLLPIGWRLLHEARKTSRHLSLVLSLAGMLILGLISLGQPWVHFQVPLMPPEGPSRPPTIPIDTILFVPCPDISCLHEYDQNAYLLDLSWAFLVISSITCFCLFVGLLSTSFFTSSNLPMLDFFLFICSIMSGAVARSLPGSQLVLLHLSLTRPSENVNPSPPQSLSPCGPRSQIHPHLSHLCALPQHSTRHIPRTFSAPNLCPTDTASPIHPSRAVTIALVI
ncbi:uncharacterized protein RHO17_001167 isoform 2-T2 [Thomomys bottae]